MRVLVIGGSGAIGSAITDTFRSNGHNTIVATHLDCDLTDITRIIHFLDIHGRDFDVVVHAAGHNPPHTIYSVSIHDIQKTMYINVTGFLFIIQQLLPYWKITRKGKIVVINSLYGHISRTNRLPYTIAKHALAGAVKSLAIDLAPYNVLVNAVSPGYIDTPMTHQNNTPTAIAKLCDDIPLGRLGTPEEVASLTNFLCSDINTYITGQDFIIDGGFSIGGFIE